MGQIMGWYIYDLEKNLTRISLSQCFFVYLPWAIYALMNMGLCRNGVTYSFINLFNLFIR